MEIRDSNLNPVFLFANKKSAIPGRFDNGFFSEGLSCPVWQMQDVYVHQ